VNDTMRRYASIDGPYRYWLERQWGAFAPWFTVVMLNPSTADAEKDDPTLRVCMRLAQREGFGNLQVFNLFAYRTPDPRELKRAQKAGVDVVGIGNPSLLTGAALGTIGPIMVGWGANPIARDQAAWFTEEAVRLGKDLVCVGVNQDGSPKHPLYMKSDAPLVPWPSV